MDLIGLLVTLVILCVVIYAVHIVVGMIALPQPIKTLIYLLIAVIVLLWMLDRFGIYHFAR
jgi:hypothetical protein